MAVDWRARSITQSVTVNQFVVGLVHLSFVDVDFCLHSDKYILQGNWTRNRDYTDGHERATGVAGSPGAIWKKTY
jgi:hypothetical protein